jgi:hypothetical protein
MEARVIRSGEGVCQPALSMRTGDESVVFMGDAGRGEEFVTKVMPLSGGKWFGFSHPAEQVARLMLWRGMTGNSDLSRILYLRGVLLEGVPALLMIQEREIGEEVDKADLGAALRGLSRMTLDAFDNISTENLIGTRDGYKVVDAMLKREVKEQALSGCRDLRRCECVWYDFVRMTSGGFGEVPEGYAVPDALRKRYSPESNPWISEIEEEVPGQKTL